MINVINLIFSSKKLSDLFKKILKSKFQRRTILVFIDLGIIFFSFIFSFLIKYELDFFPYLKEAFWLLKTQFLIAIPIYLFTGQYSSLSNFFELKIIFK